MYVLIVYPNSRSTEIRSRLVLRSTHAGANNRLVRGRGTDHDTQESGGELASRKSSRRVLRFCRRPCLPTQEQNILQSACTYAHPLHTCSTAMPPSVDCSPLGRILRALYPMTMRWAPRCRCSLLRSRTHLQAQQQLQGSTGAASRRAYSCLGNR